MTRQPLQPVYQQDLPLALSSRSAGHSEAASSMSMQHLMRNLRTQLRHEHSYVEVLHVHAGQDAPHGRLTAQWTACSGHCVSKGGAIM